MVTFAIGIFALTDSIKEKSISATAIPVDTRSETGKPELDVKKNVAADAASMHIPGTEIGPKKSSLF